MWEIVICDADAGFAKMLEEKLYAFYQSRDFEARVTICLNGQEFVKAMDQPVDLVFMNTRLPDMTGYIPLEVIRLRPEKEKVIIILLSEHDEDVFDAFTFQPFAYIRKKFFEQEFERGMKRLWATDHRMRSIRIRFRQKERLVRVSDIMYMESQGHYVDIYCINGLKYRFRSSIGYLLKLLEGNYFAQPSKSYLVNCAYVKEIRKKVILSDDTEIPCSKSRKSQTEKMWQRYIQEITHCMY